MKLSGKARKGIILIALLIVTLSEVNAQKFDVDAALADVNGWCQSYDVYKRVFTFNPATYAIISTSESCVVTMPAKDLSNVAVEPSGDSYSVMFYCSDSKDCIIVDCNSFDDEDYRTSITITNKDYAQKIADKLNLLITNVKSGNYTYTGSKSTAATTSGSFDIDAALSLVNQWCQTYDLYQRVFTFNSYSGKITLTSESCVVDMLATEVQDVTVSPSGENYSVLFTIIDNKESINVDCGSKYTTYQTSITVSNKDYAQKIADQLNLIVASVKSKNYTYSGKTVAAPSTSSSYDVYAALKMVNEWSQLYDVYKRVWTYKASTYTLNSKSSLCSVDIPAKKINNLVVEKSGSDFIVKFYCANEEKAISVDCDSFDEMNNMTGITINNEDYAKKIADKLNEVINNIKKM